MACVTQYLHRVPQTNSAWLFRGPQILADRLVASHADAKTLSQPEREAYGRCAAESLNNVTQRGEDGNCWLPMKSGNDKAQRWTAKAYVNITNEDLEVQITGPLGTVDANTKVSISIPAGQCLVTTITSLTRGKFARNFTSKKHGTKGVVFVGTIAYVPPQNVVSDPSSQESPSQGRGGGGARVEDGGGGGGRREITTRSSAQKQQLKLLNDAYKSLGQGPRECLNELLDIKQSEVDSIFAMKATKRRKVQLAFNLLSWCDEELYAMARSIADDESGDEEDDQGEAESAPEAPPSQDSSSQGDAQMGGKKAATDAAYAMKMKGMKGMKTIAPSGRKAPLVSLH